LKSAFSCCRCARVSAHSSLLALLKATATPGSRVLLSWLKMTPLKSGESSTRSCGNGSWGTWGHSLLGAARRRPDLAEQHLDQPRSQPTEGHG